MLVENPCAFSHLVTRVAVDGVFCRPSYSCLNVEGGIGRRVGGGEGRGGVVGGWQNTAVFFWETPGQIYRYNNTISCEFYYYTWGTYLVYMYVCWVAVGACISCMCAVQR